jgi:hypothetical protein
MGNKPLWAGNTMFAKERMTMNRGMNGFAKGIGTGMAVGMAAGIAGTMMYSGNKKMIKKKAAKAVKAIGGIVDDVQSMMK